VVPFWKINSVDVCQSTRLNKADGLKLHDLIFYARNTCHSSYLCEYFVTENRNKFISYLRINVFIYALIQQPNGQPQRKQLYKGDDKQTKSIRTNPKPK
jgi:hypothetical protein